MDDQLEQTVELEQDDMSRLQECYKYLEEFTRRRNMPLTVIQALHRQAAEILKGLK